MQTTPTAVNRKARVHLSGPCVITDALIAREPLLVSPSLSSPGRKATMPASQDDELEEDEEEGLSL